MRTAAVAHRAVTMEVASPLSAIIRMAEKVPGLYGTGIRSMEPGL
jgi:hypothetical protein